MKKFKTDSEIHDIYLNVLPSSSLKRFFSVLIFSLSCSLFLPGHGSASSESALFSTDLDEEANLFLRLPFDQALNIASHKGDETITWVKPKKFEIRKDLGLTLGSNKVVRHILRHKKELIFDVKYSIDPYGRRVIPIKKTQNREFLYFWGCSHTFGQGVNDNETFPYYISEQLPETAVYSYGVPGKGSNSLLAYVENVDLRSQIPEKHGTFVYVFTDGEGHVERSAGILPSIKWLGHSPYYEWKGNQLVRNGSFITGRPIYTRILLYLRKAFDFFGLPEELVFPPLSKSDYLKACQFIKQSKDLLQQKLPGTSFLVFIHPTSQLTDTSKECLTNNNIEIIQDSSAIIHGLNIPHDDHLTPAGNKVVADAFLKIFLKKGRLDLNQ